MSESTHIILLTHGEFGKHLINSAELIIGDIPNIHSFSLTQGMSLKELINNLEETVRPIQERVILLTDLFGGTPNNAALYMNEKYDVSIISGVNLPVLLELATARNDSNKKTKELARTVFNNVQKSIQLQT